MAVKMNRVSDSIDPSQGGFKKQKQSEPLVTTTHPLIHLINGKEATTTTSTTTATDVPSSTASAADDDDFKNSSSNNDGTNLPPVIQSTSITGAFKNLKSNLTDDSFDSLMLVGGIGKKNSTQKSSNEGDADIDFLTDGDKVCPVKCNAIGSMVPISCDPIRKICKCKSGVAGRQCDRCDSLFWGLHLIASQTEGCTGGLHFVLSFLLSLTWLLFFFFLFKPVLTALSSKFQLVTATSMAHFAWTANNQLATVHVNQESWVLNVTLVHLVTF